MGGARRIGWAIKDPKHCRDLIAKAVEAFGRINILVNNAAHLSGATVAVTGGEPVL